MNCCKDNLLVYLIIEDACDEQHINSSLQSILEYTEEQASQAIDFAKRKGKCLLFEGSTEDVKKISISLAKSKINAEIKTKSIK